MAWESGHRSNLFFSPPVYLCSVTFMTEMSSTVTLKVSLVLRCYSSVISKSVRPRDLTGKSFIGTGKNIFLLHMLLFGLTRFSKPVQNDFDISDFWFEI